MTILSWLIKAKLTNCIEMQVGKEALAEFLTALIARFSQRRILLTSEVGLSQVRKGITGGYLIIPLTFELSSRVVTPTFGVYREAKVEQFLCVKNLMCKSCTFWSSQTLEDNLGQPE